MEEDRSLDSDCFDAPCKEGILAAEIELLGFYDHADKKLFEKHKDEVNCIAFSSDLEMMVTGSDDGRVRIFNRITGELVTRLFGHKGSITGVAVSSDSALIASCSFDRTVKVWRTRMAMLVFTMEGHSSSVASVCFSPDSKLLSSSSWDCTAIVWNLESGSPKTILEGHKKAVECCCFSKNNRILATGSWDCDVRLWNISHDPSLPSCSILIGHSAAVHSVAFSKLGVLASGSHDKTIRLWNPRTLTLMALLQEHSGWIRALAFNAEGTVLASVSDDDTAKIWDASTGECAKTLNVDDYVGQVLCCVFSPDNKLLVGGDSIRCSTRKKEDSEEAPELQEDDNVT